MKKIGNIAVIIKNGDIAAKSVECIVVPEFKNCASYGGVGAAIAYHGMKKGLDNYDDIAQKTTLNYGDVVITESGKQGVHLAHVATAGANKEEQFKIVFQAMLKVLAEADKLGVRTIAVPELGAGIIGNLTQTQSAKAVFAAIYQFSQLRPQNSVEEIQLVIYRNSIEPAEQVLSQQSFDFKDEIGEKEFDFGAWLVGMGLV